MMADVSPPQGLQLPSIDEYDLSGLFAQSMDDTLRLDKSDENVDGPMTSFGNFESIAGKLESFNAGNKKTLSTVPSDGFAALPPVVTSTTAMVPVAALDMSQLSELRGVTQKVLMESREKINKFDPFFEKFNFFIFQGSHKKISDAILSLAAAFTEAADVWGVIQIPGAFDSTGVVLIESGPSGTSCHVTGLQLKAGGLAATLTAFGIENMTVTKTSSTGSHDAASSEDEDAGEDTTYASIEISGRRDVVGFFNFLRSLILAAGEMRRSPVLVASCPFRHAVAETPEVVVKKGATSSRFIEMEHFIFPISVFGNLIAPLSPSLIKISVLPDAQSFRAFNPSAVLQKDNVISFSN